MDYLNTNLKWEDFFSKESVDLEQKMLSLDMDSLAKSKIRLSLENNILDWPRYERWVIENFGCASLRGDISKSDLTHYLEDAKQAYSKYLSFDFWNEDLLPVSIWDNQLIVFGLHFNENLLKIENHIFILAPPEVLSYFAENLLGSSSSSKISSDSELLDLTQSKIEGLVTGATSPNLDFKNLKFESSINTNPGLTETKPATVAKKTVSENDVWAFIDERHNEYIFEVKKQYSAYLVLRIDYDLIARVYKMDPDLEKENINSQLFTYSLKEENPFKRVYENGQYESFNLSQLNLNLKNYKYACINALKAGDKVVGFLLGFKDTNLTEIDQMLLEELAKETAA